MPGRSTETPTLIGLLPAGVLMICRPTACPHERSFPCYLTRKVGQLQFCRSCEEGDIRHHWLPEEGTQEAGDEGWSTSSCPQFHQSTSRMRRTNCELSKANAQVRAAARPLLPVRRSRITLGAWAASGSLGCIWEQATIQVESSRCSDRHPPLRPLMRPLRDPGMLQASKTCVHSRWPLEFFGCWRGSRRPASTS